MATDIIEEVRNEIGTKPVPKIDPNTQSPVEEEAVYPDAGSGIIPAILLGFYKHTRNEEASADILKQRTPEETINHLFGDQKKNIIKSVADYAHISEEKADDEMKNAAVAVKKVLDKEITNTDGKSVTAFFTDQRSNILKHLPVELQMGEFINDTSVDDRTNKMEGPMSGLMHGIEKLFSSTK